MNSGIRYFNFLRTRLLNRQSSEKFENCKTRSRTHPVRNGLEEMKNALGRKLICCLSCCTLCPWSLPHLWNCLYSLSLSHYLSNYRSISVHTSSTIYLHSILYTLLPCSLSSPFPTLSNYLSINPPSFFIYLVPFSLFSFLLNFPLLSFIYSPLPIPTN